MRKNDARNILQDSFKLSFLARKTFPWETQINAMRSFLHAFLINLQSNYDEKIMFEIIKVKMRLNSIINYNV